MDLKNKALQRAIEAGREFLADMVDAHDVDGLKAVKFSQALDELIVEAMREQVAT